MEGRNEAEEHAGGERHAERECEDAPINADHGKPDYFGRTESDQGPHAPGRQEYPEDTCDQRQQQAFSD
jgi:hypothetical protein